MCMTIQMYNTSLKDNPKQSSHLMWNGPMHDMHSPTSQFLHSYCMMKLSSSQLSMSESICTVSLYTSYAYWLVTVFSAFWWATAILSAAVWADVFLVFCFVVSSKLHCCFLGSSYHCALSMPLCYCEHWWLYLHQPPDTSKTRCSTPGVVRTGSMSGIIQ